MFDPATELNTQLTSFDEFDANNLRFSPVVNDSSAGMKSKRIRYAIVNADNTIGDVIFEHNKLFAFGVQANIDKQTQKLSGYSVPMCLWNKNGPSASEKRFVEINDEIVERTKQHMLANKKEIGEKKLDIADLREISPLWYKTDDEGEIVPGRGPMLYAKLIYSKKNDKILTAFRDTYGNRINPLDLVDKYIHIIPAIRYESVYIGAKIKIQVKIYEAIVKLADSGFKSLLRGHIEEDADDDGTGSERSGGSFQ